MSLEEYRELMRAQGKQPKNKYNSNPCDYDNVRFDSKKERDRYVELLQLQRAGKIKDLKRQVTYDLQPGFYHKGKKIQKISYIADFVYTDTATGEEVIEDVKSYATAHNAVYKLKKKMMLYRGLEIKEIM